MRSIKRKNENTEAQSSSKQSSNVIQRQFRDESTSAYRIFFDPIGNKELESDCVRSEKTNVLSYETNVIPQEPIQKHEDYLPLTLNYEEVGRSMVDEFGNVIEGPIVYENSGLTLYNNISGESNTLQNTDISFEQTTSTTIASPEINNIYDESNESRNTYNSDAARFLPHFNTTESTGEQYSREKVMKHVEEYVFTPQETLTTDINQRTFNVLSNTDIDYSSGELSLNQVVSKETEEQLQVLNNMLEMVKNPIMPEISSKHSIHEAIDTQLINEIVFLENVQDPTEYYSENNTSIEYNSEENIETYFFQGQYSPQTSNVANNINATSYLEYNEITEGSSSTPELQSTYCLPSSSKNSTVMEPSSEQNTFLEGQSVVSTNQPNYNLMITGEASSCMSEASPEPVTVDYMERIYSKIIEHISINIPSFSSSSWQKERIDGIILLIDHVKRVKSCNFSVIRNFIIFIDNQIMLILNKLNLRGFSELKKYELHEYSDFNYALKCAIHELNLYGYMINYNEEFKENILPILCTEFVLLFDYFPNFPELMTLGSLFNQGGDENLILYVRIINLIIFENTHRL